MTKNDSVLELIGKTSSNTKITWFFKLKPNILKKIIVYKVTVGFIREFTLSFNRELPSVQFSSVAQSCLTLCDPMNHSTPHTHHPAVTDIHGPSDLFPNIKFPEKQSLPPDRGPYISYKFHFTLSLESINNPPTRSSAIWDGDSSVDPPGGYSIKMHRLSRFRIWGWNSNGWRQW